MLQPVESWSVVARDTNGMDLETVEPDLSSTLFQDIVFLICR